MSQFLVSPAGINTNPGPSIANNSNPSSHIPTPIQSQSQPKPKPKPTLKCPTIVITKKTKTNHSHTTNNSHNSKPNKKSLKTNPLKIQTDFMDAMTNTIIRYLDKNPDSSKSSAEESVFAALGYDLSIETQNSQNLQQNISHFRRHHIMRNRDAIRTFRIKELHKHITTNFPNYDSTDILIHLTKQLNTLYLPSPSPPPPLILTQKNDSRKPVHQSKKDKIIIIAPPKQTTNTTKIVRNTHKSDMNRGKAKKSVINRQFINMNYTKKPLPINSVKMNANLRKKRFEREVSPSHIYVNTNYAQRKGYKKRDKGRLRKKQINKAENRYFSNVSKAKKPQSRYYQYYNEYNCSKEEEMIAQKIALHKKSRKRKLYTANSVNTFEFAQTKQPIKKRKRIETHSAHSEDDQSDIDVDTSTNSRI